jgi:hypothetical protein
MVYAVGHSGAFEGLAACKPGNDKTTESHPPGIIMRSCSSPKNLMEAGDKSTH